MLLKSNDAIMVAMICVAAGLLVFIRFGLIEISQIAISCHLRRSLAALLGFLVLAQVRLDSSRTI